MEDGDLSVSDHRLLQIVSPRVYMIRLNGITVIHLIGFNMNATSRDRRLRYTEIKKRRQSEINSRKEIDTDEQSGR